MECGDRRLDLVRPNPTPLQGRLHEVDALRDGLLIPLRPILLLEQDQPPICDPRFAPGIVQQHECEESLGLGFGGHEFYEEPSQPDGFVTQIGANQGV